MVSQVYTTCNFSAYIYTVWGSCRCMASVHKTTVGLCSHVMQAAIQYVTWSNESVGPAPWVETERGREGGGERRRGEEKGRKGERERGGGMGKEGRGEGRERCREG